MRTAEEWMRDLIHRTSLLDMTLADIRAIQRDAIEAAAKVCEDTANEFMEGAAAWTCAHRVLALLPKETE